ncbi:T9SS type B sorting domain-containing protein [Mangrovimonas sp. TPBH4]|uniref:T9SS type B sorting domain-containing protein n=1 Tax=Mangrovimonas sp. TPBH4 TaxID=1645914 RepID=UPI0006B616D8|nr:T9SS type B sorting domain-containing protein [Mangrovimonas sp. TPBH4]
MKGSYNFDLILILVLFLGFVPAFAQLENNIWYFGENAGVNFNNSSPTALSNGQLSTVEGCASISNSSGELLFYTDGITVWNRNHQIMLNGTGLNGHSSSANSAVIVPKPCSSNVYYIFTTDAEESESQSGFQYSEVNMALGNGLGGITGIKNVSLNTSNSESIAVVGNYDENIFWVVTADSDHFLAFQISNSGVNETPVQSDLGGNIALSTAFTTKFSASGARLVSCIGYQILICDFNNITGEVSSPLVVDFSGYGLEFSPNENLIYVSYNPWIWFSEVYQFDITLENGNEILESGTLINGGNQESYSTGALQIGPDGKIYVSIVDSPYLAVINNPNIAGLGCDFQSQGIYLNGANCQAGLPMKVPTNFGGCLSIISEDICFGNAANFSLEGDLESIESVMWDFGDPESGTDNFSSNFETVHNYSNPGVYEVSATVEGSFGIVSLLTNVTVYEMPLINPSVDFYQCDFNLNGFTVFNLNEVLGEILANFNGESVSFYTSEENALNEINEIMEPNAYWNESEGQDIVWVRVENVFGCFDIAQVNLFVSISQIPDDFVRNVFACDLLDGVDGDGISIFDLSDVNQEIQDMFAMEEDLVVSYFRNEMDALLEINEILDIENYTNEGYPYEQQLYVRVESNTDNDCIGFGGHLNLYVVSPPEFTVVSPVYLCDSEVLQGVLLEPIENLPSQNYLYFWESEDGSFLSNDVALNVSTPGTYYITLAYSNSLQCAITKSIEVNLSGLASIDIEDVLVVELSGNNSLTVENINDLGLGEYEFSLDYLDGPYQDEPYFEQIGPGTHILYVRDKNGCGIVSLVIEFMSFPKFFTPNNDGFNDTWNIRGLPRNLTNGSTVYIYNRYGKLIEKFYPKEESWDGKLNGEVLPSSDYWFVAEMMDNEGNIKKYRGHFSLVR